MNFSFCLAASLIALLSAAPAAQALPINAQGRSCHLPGSEEALRCVSVPVALDYKAPGAAKLNLHVTVAPAFREAARPDPLFVLAGGPGQAGSDLLPLLDIAFRKVRATRDIVFIDQRGTGLSGKLDCDNDPADERMSEAQADAAARACIASIKQPFAAYTTEAAARDIEQVRLALGYNKINLWGGSYGTRLGQAYARAFPAALRSMILDGVAAPDQIVTAGGRDAQSALDTLFAQCAADAACNKAYPALRAEFSSVSARVAGGQVKLDIPDPRTAQPLRLTMTSSRFLGTVHSILYSPFDSRRLPFLIHNAFQGRWAPFVARSNTANDFSLNGAIAPLLYLSVVCAEDYPRLTPQLLAADTEGSFMSAPVTARVAALCDVIKVPAVAYRAPARIDAPALLLSGALDPVTPPRRAEAAAKSMAHAQQLVVAHAGHGISHLGCAPRLLREFLDQPQQAVAAECLKEIPAPTFQLGSAGPQP
ncbi:MAG: alpha/beta fold hydrolase [Telluria sp.]|nr:alpha/beta fold hydrolase [Telluria sp.]